MRPSEMVVVIHGQLLSDTVANVYDLQGRLVVSKALDDTQTEQLIDVSGAAPGVYIVQLSGRDTSRTEKILIK